VLINEACDRVAYTRDRLRFPSCPIFFFFPFFSGTIPHPQHPRPNPRPSPQTVTEYPALRIAMNTMYHSCYTCRRRRIECRMVTPPCAKCKNAGIECFQKRPLRWVQGAEYRGKAKKRAPGNVSSVVSVADSGFRTTSNTLVSTGVNGGTRAPRGYLSTGPTEFDGGVFNPMPSVPSNMDDPTSLNLNRSSQYYLYYCKCEHHHCSKKTELTNADSKCVCKLFIMYDSNRNPLRNLIPASLNQPVLLNSVLALSARHMENAGQSFQVGVSTSSSALWFKYKAIQGLSQALNDTSLCRQDTTAASAFLLIFLDLLESGGDKWTIHLEGIKKLIAQIYPPSSSIGSQQGLSQTVQGLRDFISRQIYLYAY